MIVKKIKNVKPISFAIFVPTLIVVLIALTTVVFPALVLRTMGGTEDYIGINPFEVGVWAYPVLTTNVIVFGFAVLYWKNKIPQKIKNSLEFIFNFEVSKEITILAIIVILGFYILFTVPELFVEEWWPDYHTFIDPGLDDWTIDDVFRGFNIHVKNFLLSSSNNIFGKYQVIPFIASIALLILTYVITTNITRKRFAGIVSMVVLLQSGTFWTHDTSAVYSNFWVLFYLLSLYVIIKKWYFSAPVFILSLFSKPLSALFVPMTFFFIYRSDMSTRNKIFTFASYVVVISIGLGVMVQYNFYLPSSVFESHDFWRAINSISFQLRFDGLILMFILPLIFGLFVASRKNVLHADSMLVLIMGMLLSQPIIAAFTVHWSEPYRFMPLITFFAIGVGILLSQRTREST